MLRNPAPAFLFAIAAAGGALTDPILLAPSGAIALWLLPRVPRRSWAAMALLAGALLLPWTLRNYLVHDRLTLVKNSFAYVFWQGNTPGSHGTDKLVPRALPAAAFDPAAAVRNADAVRSESRAVNDLLSAADLHQLIALPNEAARMDWFAARIRRELAADPWQYRRMCLLRLRQWLWFDETNPRAAVWHYRACYLALLALAAAGVWRRGVPAALGGPCLWAGLALTGVHVLVIGSARFRIPAEMLLLAAAAGAFVRTDRGGESRRWRDLFGSSVEPPPAGRC